MILQELLDKNLIQPPKWLVNNCHYLTIMGSVAYGVSSDTSDMDVYGWCFPPIEVVFPHIAGEIEGFGRQKERFQQYQQHHILDKDAMAGKGRSYDFAIYNITRYFTLLMENNPNIIDSLFTPINCVLHSTPISNLVRENRKMFLHKGCYHKFLGYAHSQLHKMGTKDPKAGSKRKELREQFGMDVKFAYHLIRLADEAEQILTMGDLDLQRAHEHMKAVRRGEVSEEDIRAWFAEKERTLEKMYAESKLPYSPDEGKIKTLLLECLEAHYGSLDKFQYSNPDAATTALKEISDVIEKHRKLIGQ